MIIDLKEIAGNPEFSCDLCVVGSGAAGMTLASQMLDSQLKVIIVESGGFEHEAQTQALYDVEMSGLPFPGATQGRFRVHGGSTTRWGGQALPLMPIDFEQRDWIAHSGWPIKFNELKPYYTRASEFLLLDKMNFDSDLFPYLKAQPPIFNQLWYHFSKWTPTPNIRENYFSSIKTSDNCTLLLHANVTNIVLDENRQSVLHMDVCSLFQQRAKIRAKSFVLCTGGIESARLLLSNNKQQLNGIGNDHDLVGRFFQDHPSASIGWLKTSNFEEAQRLFNVFHKRKVKYSVRCTAPEEWQRNQQTLNMSAGITFVEENSLQQDLKDLYRAIRGRNFNLAMLHKLVRLAKHPSEIISPTWHYLLRGRSYSPSAKFRVGLTSEQEPNSESRIFLSDRKDALGIPLTNVQWKLTELTYSSIQHFSLALQREFRNTRIGEIELEPWLFDSSSNWKDHITDQYHHIGTARMHDSPHHGVVDRNCRVHGITNLFIGSSAVFPTSGHSNPTFTIIALCMRLADQLKQDLR